MKANYWDFAVEMLREEFRQDTDMAVICSWCGSEVKPGSLPATHTMCKACSTKMHALHDDQADPRRV